MKLLLFLLLAVGSLVSDARLLKRQATTNCTDPAVRKEWRSLTDTEKSSYIEAVKCLATQPSRINSASSLYDDFSSVHRILDTKIHQVASFLPWHRCFVHCYETALRGPCGYTGHATYWDWSLDYEKPFNSPIFSPDTGFGGDGDSSTKCVASGPFAGKKVSVPGTHCLQRSFDDKMFSTIVAPQVIKNTLAVDGYDSFRFVVENGVHRGAHIGIQGDMVQNYSPNDPIFFLHHTNVDRIWWQWQTLNDTRKIEFGGNKNQGDTATKATLNDIIQMLGIADDSTVESCMWVQSGPMCYTY